MNFLFELSYLNSNFTLTLGYLNLPLNNPATAFTSEGRKDLGSLLFHYSTALK